MDIRKLLIVSILIIPFQYNLFAQLDTSLSKEEMHQDFQELVSIIKDVNAQLLIRKEVTGIDNLELLKSFENKIDSISSYYRYVNLLNDALNSLFDIHSVMTGRYSETYDNLTGIDRKAIKEIKDGYSKWKNEHTYKLKWFPCNPSYINGSYYLHGKYFFIRKSTPFDTIKLVNPKIVSFQGKPYFDYVQKNLSRYYRGSVRWDFKNKKYYCVKSAFVKKGLLVLQEGNQSPRSFDLDSFNYAVSGISSDKIAEEFRAKKKSSHPKRSKQVLFLDKEKVLYIYLNDMVTDFDTVISKIFSTTKGKDISKIIIDVRGNRGGSDIYWHDLISVLIADSLPYNSKLAFCNSSKLINYFDKPKEFLSNVDTVSFNWLDVENEFLVTTKNKFYITPNENSIKFKRKIYVIQDENVFSAGHSLSSYCSQVEQLVSVGQPTGLLAGFGISPFIFQLHNSKFTFRMEPAIDVANVESAVDVYHDIPEILIDIPFEEQIKELDYKWLNKKSIEYLRTKDYVIMKVLKMK